MTRFLELLRWRCAAAFVCALGLTSALPRAGAAEGDLQSQLLADVDDGALDRFDFLAAALIASGVEQPCELDGWHGDFTSRRDEIVGWVRAEFPPGDQRAALLIAARAQILRGAYSNSASDLRRTIGAGEHNCLSAVAIQYDLCRAAGFEPSIWLSPGHVSLDPPVSSTPAARKLTPVQLLGKFFYNRGVLALEAGRYDEGTRLLRTSLKLDPVDADARENLLAGLNNWAVAKLQAGRDREAAELIRQGMAIDAKYAPLAANRRLMERAP